MTTFFSPVGNDQTVDQNGEPLVGGWWEVYLAGTTTPTTTWTSNTGLVPQPAQIILDASGRPTNPIWLTGGVPVKFRLFSALGAILLTLDNIVGVGDQSASPPDQWVLFGGPVTYASANSFTVAGDQRGIFQPTRRVKLIDASNVLYGTVVSAAFSVNTTVTVALDSGALTADLSAVWYSLVSPQNGAIFTWATYPEIFGAVGDGVTDDTTAIESWLASSRNCLVMIGDYLVSRKLTQALNDRTIFAVGGACFRPTAAIAAADYVLTVTGDRTKISGVTFTGDPGVTLCGALQITTADDCRVTENYFTDFENGGAIVATSAGSGHWISQNFIRNCAPVELGGNQYGSIHCNASKSTVFDNKVYDNDLTGVSTNGGDYLSILANYIEGKSGSSTSGGIITDGACIGNKILGNTINGCAVEGIQIAGSITTYGAATRDHLVAYNMVLEAQYSAFTLFGAQADSVDNVSIVGNHARYSGTTGRGLELNRATGVNFVANYVFGYDKGVNVANATPHVNISSNSFENQTTDGIEVYGRKWVVDTNRIVGNGSSGTTTGIKFNGSATAGEQLITGNQIASCLVGAEGTFSGAQRTYLYTNHFIDNGTDTNYTSQAPNSSQWNVTDKTLSGEFTLVAGAANVANAQLSANDQIVLSKKTAGGTAGAVYVNGRTNSTGFTVASTSGTDTSVYTYQIVR